MKYIHYVPEAALLTVAAVFGDRDPRSIAFAQLKSWSLRNCKPEARCDLCKVLNDIVNADQERPPEVKDAWRLRSRIVVHFATAPILDEKKKRKLLASFSKIWPLLDEARRQFGLFPGAREFGLYPVQYDPQMPGVGAPTPIGGMLEALARGSEYLATPHQRPEVWAETSMPERDWTLFREWYG